MKPTVELTRIRSSLQYKISKINGATYVVLHFENQTTNGDRIRLRAGDLLSASEADDLVKQGWYHIVTIPQE